MQKGLESSVPEKMDEGWGLYIIPKSVIEPERFRWRARQWMGRGVPDNFNTPGAPYNPQLFPGI
jgi:hypothetical protein